MYRVHKGLDLSQAPPQVVDLSGMQPPQPVTQSVSIHPQIERRPIGAGCPCQRLAHLCESCRASVGGTQSSNSPMPRPAAFRSSRTSTPKTAESAVKVDSRGVFACSPLSARKTVARSTSCPALRAAAIKSSVLRSPLARFSKSLSAVTFTDSPVKPRPECRSVCTMSLVVDDLRHSSLQ